MSFIYREIQGDLFTTPSNVSLAHCVSTDMQMSKGIAKIFRDRYNRVDELIAQSTNRSFLFRLRCLDFLEVPVGGCAYLVSNDQCIFYLVTKERYFHKPTMSSLESSLRAMRDLCLKNDIHRLAMPRIGCGLDKLDWNAVSRLIQTIFVNDDMQITIYTQ